MQLDISSEPSLCFTEVVLIFGLSLGPWLPWCNINARGLLWLQYLRINIHHHTKFEPPKSNGSRDINFYLVIFGPMNYFLVTDGQTDRRTDGRRRIRAHRALAPVGSKMTQDTYSVVYQS